jgi:hypothetical protein
VRRGVAAAAIALAAALPAAAGADAGLVAEQIDAQNVAERQIGGPDAIGGLGDWYLANDVVEVVVDDPGRRHGKLNHGGTIVDAGVRGRDGDDQFARLFPILNLDQRVFLDYDTMRAEVDPAGRFARLVVSGSRGLDSVARPGLLGSYSLLVPEAERIARVRAETEYLVRPGEPFVHVTTRLRNEGDEPAPIFSYGDVWMRGGRSMRSFVGNTLAPQRSPGFHHHSFDRGDILGSGDAMAPFTFVAMPGVAGLPPITYAIFSPERSARGLWSFGVTGEHVNLVNAFTFDPPWSELGLWRLLRATRHTLAPGEEWSYSRRLLVLPGGDVAAATDRIFPLLGFADGSSGVALQVDPPGVRASALVERAEDGAPVTQLAAGSAAGGSARAVLPPGEYRLTVRAEQRPPQELRVSVEPGAFSEARVRLPAPATLRFDPAFADGGPGRIVFEGLGDTPDPVFGDELLEFRVDDRRPGSASETPELTFAGNASDPLRVAIAPGRYRLTATRGPTSTIAQRELEVPADGAELRVPPFELRRVVALDGVVSADLHVHAQASDDSQTPNAQRLKAFVAEGVDVLVSTDHDHVASYDEALDATGLRDRIRVRIGVEVTSSAPSPAAPWTLGHHNAWPLPHRPELHRSGAPPSQQPSVAELYAKLRGEYGVQVVQLNHALPEDGGVDEQCFLSHLGRVGEPFDPSRPIGDEPNRVLLERASDRHTRAIDFDAMEVMNGHKWHQYLALRAAWYSLLRQGFRRTATGNSDTHGPDEEAGYPRNYVYLGPPPWDDPAFDAALREGRSFASTGPLIAAFRANDGRMGDQVAAPGGTLDVRLAVAAAPWVPVDEVRLLVNGEVRRRFRELAPPEEVVRLSRSETLHLSRDAFVTLEAGAPLDIEPERWRRERGGVYASTVARGFVSQALSNPIFVDVDGDGHFTPPGLDTGPGSAERRLIWVSALVGGLALLWWWLRRRSGLAGLPPGTPPRP